MKKVLLFSDMDCPPCKMLRPMAEQMAERYGFEYENFMLEDSVTPFVKYGVTGVPVFVILNEDENECGRFNGHQTQTSLEANLRKYGVI